MNLVPICVDVVQTCGGKADLSSLVRDGGRRGRTTYGCAKFFVRVLGLCAKEDVLGLTAHRWRDSVKAQRRHVLILACQ
jgi:hypothetical protein